MKAGALGPALLLHAGIIVLVFALQFVVGDYQLLTLGRILVLAVFATGYNLLFGYAGLLSLGHAMFFAAGIYGAGLTASPLGWSAPPAFLAGIAAGFVLALVLGPLALRTSGVAFMIVTMMFAQALYLSTLYFNDYTGGDEGFTLPDGVRHFSLLGIMVRLSDPVARYNLALVLLALCLLASLAIVQSRFGRVLAAIRQNEERARMLGYDTFRYKLAALIASAVMAAAAGAAYVLLFAYGGATFASVQFSILPLLWVLLGGARTIVGPLIGTLLMFYLIDISSGYTSAYLLVVGFMLIALTLWFPKGILGTVRDRWAPWLP
jgi:branched-chain amino acid transport system permease protein